MKHTREKRNYKENLDLGESIDVGYLKIIIGECGLNFFSSGWCEYGSSFLGSVYIVL